MWKMFYCDVFFLLYVIWLPIRYKTTCEDRDLQPLFFICNQFPWTVILYNGCKSVKRWIFVGSINPPISFEPWAPLNSIFIALKLYIQSLKMESGVIDAITLSWSFFYFLFIFFSFRLLGLEHQLIWWTLKEQIL